MLSTAFRGEIWTNIDKRILEAMIEANDKPICRCVESDSYSLGAIEIMQSYFKEKIYPVFTINGTGANIIALKVMLDRYSSVICAEQAHINGYEAGAFEYALGNKILAINSENGKISPDDIKALLKNKRKYNIPKVVVITQPTELGTLYTQAELKELCDYVHSEGMYVYIDGARLGNAVIALNTTLTEMIEYPDVDAFSFGGTKSGAMFGEMVVFRRKEFSGNLPYIRKQSFQHFDKSKFLGVQFKCLLENNIWLENAEKANRNAKALESAFLKKGLKAYYPVESNMVYICVDNQQMEKLAEVYDLHYSDEELKLVRFAVTANTTENEIKKLTDMF